MGPKPQFWTAASEESGWLNQRSEHIDPCRPAPEQFPRVMSSYSNHWAILSHHIFGRNRKFGKSPVPMFWAAKPSGSPQNTPFWVSPQNAAGFLYLEGKMKPSRDTYCICYTVSIFILLSYQQWLLMKCGLQCHGPRLGQVVNLARANSSYGSMISSRFSWPKEKHPPLRFFG